MHIILRMHILKMDGSIQNMTNSVGPLPCDPCEVEPENSPFSTDRSLNEEKLYDLIIETHVQTILEPNTRKIDDVHLYTRKNMDFPMLLPKGPDGRWVSVSGAGSHRDVLP